MSSRIERIERIIRLRQQQLDAELRALGEVRRAEREAEQELALAQRARHDADHGRRAMAHTIANARSFNEAGDWVRSKSAQAELARRRLEHAQRLVAHRLEVVSEARSKVKQLELLRARVSSVEELRLAREERALEDETAQRVSRGQGGGR